MTNILFKEHRVADFVRPLTVENAFKSYFNFGQIHSQVFEQAYAMGTASWYATGNPGTGISSWSVSETELHIDASASTGDWQKVINLTAMPHSMLLKYHVEEYSQAAILGVQSDGSCYLVGTTSSQFFVSKGDSAGVYTDVYRITKAHPQIANCEVALRHIRFSDNDDDLWRCISLWMNDALIGTYIEKASSLLNNPIYFGFAAAPPSAVTYTDITVPQLTEFAETCTLDPAENPMGGLSRAIEGRYIKMNMRHNGAVRAWRPREVTSKHTFVDGQILSRNLPFDRRSISNHVRQVGAYRQAEYVRQDLIQKQGHRFSELNNPFLMSEDECYEQARLSILRMESEAESQSIVTPFTPLLQMEDRITTPSGEFVITQRDINVEQARIYQNIQARKYNLVGA